MPDGERAPGEHQPLLHLRTTEGLRGLARNGPERTRPTMRRLPARSGGGPSYRNAVAMWDEDGFLVAGTGIGNVILSDTAPANAEDGWLWFDTNLTQLFVRYHGQWVIATNQTGAGGGNVTIGVAPPANATDGALWFDPVSTQLFILYRGQWVVAVNQPGGGGGMGGAVGEAPLSGGPWLRQDGDWVDLVTALNVAGIIDSGNY